MGMSVCRSHHPIAIHEPFKERFAGVIQNAVENPPETACATCRIVDLRSGARVELWNGTELWASFKEQHELR